jgi:hypothetical protein
MAIHVPHWIQKRYKVIENNPTINSIAYLLPDAKPLT